MKIAVATYSTRPRGGVVHTLSLAEALAARGHDVTVWTLGRGGDAGFFRPVDPAVTVRAVPFADVAGEDVGTRIVRSIAVMAAAFDPDGAEVVHAQDCISANAMPGCIRTVHHLDTFTTPGLVACHERALHDPIGHICVSRAVADELRAGWGIEATVIPNGVDTARFAAAAAATARAARDEWRQCLGGAPLVVAVGGIEPRKGSLDLLDALAVLRVTHPGVRLAIAGGETLFDYCDYRATFDARLAALDMAVTVLGPVDHDALPALVAAADVFAFPSTKEGFGLAAMEALAAGVPVVTRDLPVLREVFGATVRYGHDAASLAAAMADAINGADPARTAAGRALAAAHTWDAAAEAHELVYERLRRTVGGVLRRGRTTRRRSAAQGSAAPRATP